MKQSFLQSFEKAEKSHEWVYVNRQTWKTDRLFVWNQMKDLMRNLIRVITCSSSTSFEKTAEIENTAAAAVLCLPGLLCKKWPETPGSRLDPSLSSTVGLNRRVSTPPLRFMPDVRSETNMCHSQSLTESESSSRSWFQSADDLPCLKREDLDKQKQAPMTQLGGTVPSDWLWESWVRAGNCGV